MNTKDKSVWTVDEEHELAMWIEEQMQAYRDGKLEQWQIDKLQSLPNWKW